MKILLVTLLLAICFPLISVAYDIGKLREMFYHATVDEKYAEKMLLELDYVNDSTSPVLLGYKGMAFMFLSKYALLPVTKLNCFKKGKELIETAIKKDGESIELRYFRFSVQANVPFFLNYASKIDEDKKTILRSINAFEDEKFKSHMIEFMLSCNKCSESEKMQLR